MMRTTKHVFLLSSLLQQLGGQWPIKLFVRIAGTKEFLQLLSHGKMKKLVLLTLKSDVVSPMDIQIGLGCGGLQDKKIWLQNLTRLVYLIGEKHGT